MTIMVNLRDFAQLKEEDVLRFRGYRHAVTVVDDAGSEMLSDTYSLMVTWQGMIIHRAYSDLPYSVDELVPSNKNPAFKNTVYDDDTLATPVNWALEQIMPHTDDPVENDYLKRLIHIWQTKLNNLLVVMSEASMISATPQAVAELMEDIGVMDIRDRILSGEVTIDEGEEEFSTHIFESEALSNNTMALLTRTGGVSVNQGFQTTIIRGAVFDLSNTINPNAVMVPYAHGVTNLADSLGDKNSSGKSLINNGKGLKDAEWYHRKIHMLSAVLDSIYHTLDCGAKVGVPLKIPSASFVLSLMGKYQIMPNGTTRLIDGRVAREIQVGDVVEIRSMAYCNSPVAGKPCGKCFGKMKSTIPYNVIMERDANVGMYCGTTLCNPIGQKMLSTKHFIRNATSKKFTPHTRDKNVIYSNGDEIYLQKELCVKGAEMILSQKIVPILADLKALDNLMDVGVDKLPSFTDVTFRYEVEDIMMGGMTTQQHSAITSVSSRYGHFSIDFLQYLMTKGWTVVDKRFIAVDLSEWNTLAPMFTLPHAREDLDMFRGRVENFMTFNKRNSAWKDQVVTPKIFGETLIEFWQLINQEIRGINSIHLESLLFCCTAKDPNNNSFALVNGTADRYFTSFIGCMSSRGAGTLMIAENQQNILSNYKTFILKDRQPSVLESFFHNAAR